MSNHDQLLWAIVLSSALVFQGLNRVASAIKELRK